MVLENVAKNAGEQAVDKIDHETIPEVQQTLQLLTAELDNLSAQFVRRIADVLLPKVQEVVQDAAAAGTADVHSILDRVNGTKLSFSGSVTLQVPPRNP